MDQNVVTAAHVRLQDESVESGDEDFGNSRCSDPIHAARNRSEPAFLHRDVFGMRTARCESEDAVTFLPISCAGTEVSNFTGELQARNVLHCSLRRRVFALTLQ